MRQSLRQWLHPKRVALVTIPVMFCIAIIIGIVRAPASEPATHSSQATSRVDNHTVPPKTTQPLPKSSIDEATLAQLDKRARSVVRLYASLPSQQGTKSIIDQLRHLVEPAVANKVAKQWAGVDTTGVYAKIKQINSAGHQVKPDGSVEVYAKVKQEFVFPDSSSNVHSIGLAVKFEKHNSSWVITDLAEIQGDL